MAKFRQMWSHCCCCCCLREDVTKSFVRTTISLMMKYPTNKTHRYSWIIQSHMFIVHTQTLSYLISWTNVFDKLLCFCSPPEGRSSNWLRYRPRPRGDREVQVINFYFFNMRQTRPFLFIFVLFLNANTSIANNWL